MAQVQALRETVQLITFDGDQTLYEDGGNFSQDSPLVADIIHLVQRGIRVALVTAAGYQGRPDRYEHRLSGLLAAMASQDLPQGALDNFYVMGGECNYLFRCIKSTPVPGPAAGDDAVDSASPSPSGSASGATVCKLVEVDASLWRHFGTCRGA